MGAEPGVGPTAALQVPRERVTPGAAGGGDHRLRSQHPPGGVGQDRGLPLVVHHRRHAPAVAQLPRGSRRVHQLLQCPGHQRLGPVPHLVVRRAQAAPQHGPGGDHVRRLARGDGPEHDQDVVGGGELRHPGREAAHHLGRHVDQVHREVRSGGVAAGAVEVDLHLVRRRGQRPGAHADGADVQLGVAVQAEHAVDAVQLSGADHLHRPAGNGLLRRLEDEAHPIVRQVRGQGQAGAQHHHRVDVVPTGVGEAVPLGAVGDVLVVVHGQRVDVAPQRHPGGAVTLSHVAHHPGAGRQHAGLQARSLQALDDQVGGLVLLAARLRVGMEVAPHGDQLLPVRVQEGVDPGRRAVAAGGGHDAGVPDSNSARSRSTTSWWVPPASTTRRWRT